MGLLIKRLSETAKLPTKGSSEAAGWDLYADQGASIPPGKRASIPVGFAMAIEKGKVGLIWPRSGLASKQGADRLGGVVDSDYRGEVMVLLQNHGEEMLKVRPGDRVAQMIIQRHEEDELVEVEILPDTVRGDNGFGSTG
jgi:dUTP pyrophosphatase